MTISTAKEQPPQRPLATGQPLDPTALAVPSHLLEQNTQVCPPGWDGVPGCGVQSLYSGTTLPPGATLWRGKLLGSQEVHIPGLTGSVLSRATVSASTSSVPGRPWAWQLGYESQPCHLLAVTLQASLPVPGPTQRAGERLLGGSVYSAQSARPATARGQLEPHLEHPPTP